MEATSIPALIARLAEDNPRWRAEAELRLVKHGLPALPALIVALKSPVVSVRVHAAQALGKLGDAMRAHAYAGASTAEACDGLADLLTDTEANGAAGIAAEKALILWSAVSVLGARLRGPAAPRALRALGVLRTTDEVIVTLIREALVSTDAATRTQAAVALLLTFGADSIEETAPLLRDPDKWVRYGVAEPLAKLGVRRSRVVLEAALADDDEGAWVRSWAEELLSEIEDAERNSVARE